MRHRKTPCSTCVCTSMAVPLHPEHPGWPPWGTDAGTQAEMMQRCLGASLLQGRVGEHDIRSNTDLYQPCQAGWIEPCPEPGWRGRGCAPSWQCLTAHGGAMDTRAGAGASHGPLLPVVQQQPHLLALLARSGSPATLLKGHRRSQQGRSLHLCLSECAGDVLWAEDWGTYSTITFAANRYSVCYCAVCALLKVLNWKLCIKKQRQTTELEKWQACWIKWHHVLLKIATSKNLWLVLLTQINLNS